MKRVGFVGSVMAAVAMLGITMLPSAANATSAGRNGLIAFAVQDSTGIQIATVRSDGSHFHEITSGDRVSLNPTWSPDGKVLVFAHDTSNGMRLFRTDAQGR